MNAEWVAYAWRLVGFHCIFPGFQSFHAPRARSIELILPQLLSILLSVILCSRLIRVVLTCSEIQKLGSPDSDHQIGSVAPLPSLPVFYVIPVWNTSSIGKGIE